MFTSFLGVEIGSEGGGGRGGKGNRFFPEIVVGKADGESSRDGGQKTSSSSFTSLFPTNIQEGGGGFVGRRKNGGG